MFDVLEPQGYSETTLETEVKETLKYWGVTKFCTLHDIKYKTHIVSIFMCELPL